MFLTQKYRESLERQIRKSKAIIFDITLKIEKDPLEALGWTHELVLNQRILSSCINTIEQLGSEHDEYEHLFSILLIACYRLISSDIKEHYNKCSYTSYREMYINKIKMLDSILGPHYKEEHIKIINLLNIQSL